MYVCAYVISRIFKSLYALLSAGPLLPTEVGGDVHGTGSNAQATTIVELTVSRICFLYA